MRATNINMNVHVDFRLRTIVIVEEVLTGNITCGKGIGIGTVQIGWCLISYDAQKGRE